MALPLVVLPEPPYRRSRVLMFLLRRVAASPRRAATPLLSCFDVSAAPRGRFPKEGRHAAALVLAAWPLLKGGSCHMYYWKRGRGKEGLFFFHPMVQRHPDAPKPASLRHLYRVRRRSRTPVPPPTRARCRPPSKVSRHASRRARIRARARAAPRTPHDCVLSHWQGMHMRQRRT